MSNFKPDFKQSSVDPSWRFGIVTARFNSSVTLRLKEGAEEALLSAGVSPHRIQSVEVPGAVEIPLAAKWLLQQGVDAVVALGAVIRGETSHFDYVCSSVERGCTLVQLEFACPVVFGVLTTENLEQARARCGGLLGNKGAEAAMVALEMLQLSKTLEQEDVRDENDKHI